MCLGVFLKALLTDFEMHPARLLFTQLLHLHLCAKCQWLSWGSGLLCVLGLEPFIASGKDSFGNPSQTL